MQRFRCRNSSEKQQHAQCVLEEGRREFWPKWRVRPREEMKGKKDTELYGLSVTMWLLPCALEWVGQKCFEKMNSVTCNVFKNLSMDTSL